MTTPELLDVLNSIHEDLAINREYYINSPWQLEGNLCDTQKKVRKLINALQEEETEQQQTG